jgi:hypothetical protein
MIFVPVIQEKQTTEHIIKNGNKYFFLLVLVCKNDQDSSVSL